MSTTTATTADPKQPQLILRQAGLIKFFLLLAACFFIQISALLKMSGIYDFYPKGQVINAVADSLFFAMPVLFLPRRWRPVVWGEVVILTAFFITQHLHCLAFDDFYNGTSLFASDLTDSTLISSALSLVTVDCLWFIMPPLMLSVCYIARRRYISSAVTGVRTRAISLCAFMLLPLAIYGIALRRTYLWGNASGEYSFREACMQQQVILLYPDTPKQLATYLGTGYLFFNFIRTAFPGVIELSDAERDSVAGRISTDTHSPEHLGAHNRGRSLILIIVESFNSPILDIPEASEAFPTLSRLISDSSSIVATRLLSQVSHGESSDGQFIITTGLLPFSDGAFVSHFADADYPSIVKALGYKSSAEVICEQANIWKHDITTRSYGYGKLYDSSADDNLPDRDAQVFARAINVVDSLEPPYMLMISTIDMHMPYTTPKRITERFDTSSPEWQKYDDRCLNYIAAVHEFDRCLGVFLDSITVKSASAGYASPVIAIVGDHTAPRMSLTAPLGSPYIPLIIYNAGIGCRHHQPAGQIDIFPTILDAMGVGDYILPATGRPYRGLGRSLIGGTPPLGAIGVDGKAVEGTADSAFMAQKWTLSDTIIRSRFFKRMDVPIP